MRKLLLMAAMAVLGAALLGFGAARAEEKESAAVDRAEVKKEKAEREKAPEQSGYAVKNIVQRVKKGVIRVQGIDITSPVVAFNPGGGSGFVFEVDYDTHTAYAITNYHVSGHAMVSAVKFWDGAQYRGEMVAAEPGIDVALLKIQGIPDERDLPADQKTIIPVTLGDSDQVRIGEFAMAMGNPGTEEGANVNRSDPWDTFLLGQTVTTNVVTGRDTPLEFEISIWQQNRTSLSWQYGTNFPYTFRVSVPINGGNSGGPLFNAKGEVIGINFYGGAFVLMQNHNWSIPINIAKDFVTQILETGKFERPWLGVDIIMPPYIKGADQYVEFVERYRPENIEIYGVRKDSPAAKLGPDGKPLLQKGDIILEVDGQEFKSPEDLRLYIFNLDIGTPVTLTVSRKDPNTKRYKKLAKPVVVEVGAKRKFNAEFSV